VVAGSRPRSRWRLLTWLVPLVALPAVILVGLLASLVVAPDENSVGCAPSYEPSRAALADIPEDYLKLYVAAGSRLGVGWEYLAAIGAVESDHGRLRAGGVRDGANSAGAAGPMQFLGSTWASYGVDGDGDGRRDVYDPADAIPSTAAYLRASGAPDDYGRALFAYNHAGWYVADVQERAADYRGAAGRAEVADETFDAPASDCAATLALGQANARDVLGNPRLEVYPQGQADLRAGVIDPRITTLLDAFGRTHVLTVSSLQTGHGIFTTSGRRSNHADGRAVDISAVDGVSCRVISRTGPCGRLASAAGRLTGPAAPSEVIYCFDPGPGSNSFARADHCDHVHIGHDAG
jgi:hypothetical protein